MVSKRLRGGEEFLDESREDTEAFGDLLTRGVALVVGVHDALAQVHGDCFHEESKARQERDGYMFLKTNPSCGKQGSWGNW